MQKCVKHKRLTVGKGITESDKLNGLSPASCLLAVTRQHGTEGHTISTMTQDVCVSEYIYVSYTRH